MIRRGGDAGSLPLLQAVQAHRGHLPERLHEAGFRAQRHHPGREPEGEEKVNYECLARSLLSKRAAGFSIA